MAISINSVVGFNSTSLQAKYQRASDFYVGPSALKKPTQFTSSSGIFGSMIHVKERRRTFCLSVADSNSLVTDASDKGDPGGSESSASDSLSSSDVAVSADSVTGNPQFQTSVDKGTQIPAASNGAAVSSDLRPAVKRSPLTARERLRAARVLSRYTDRKPTKSEMGRKVLDAMKESDGGKRRSGLPEAPTNLFDDSKRGMPKPGWTFQFPGGSDLFVIAFSFVFISTVMFATTYIVWKVGAIHFNEY